MTEKLYKFGKGMSIAMLTLLLLIVFLVSRPMNIEAKESNATIPNGILVEELDLSGMTIEEAHKAVAEYVEMISARVITFGVVDEHYVAITAGDLGLEWINQDVVTKLEHLGEGDNIVQRYKRMKDLKNGNMVYQIELDFDKDLIANVIVEQCKEYDIKAVNTSLKKTENGFEIIEGKTGLEVDADASLQYVYDYLVKEWNHKDASVDLIIVTTQPKGNRDELARVKDVLGTFTTEYTRSTQARCKNVENGCARINGVTLYPGEEFSACETMRPFTEENGYYPAGAYLNGKVIESIGGGICQVSTTLYNAVLLSELEVTQRNSHSMIVDYVKPSMDAAIAENGGKDFRFVNNLEYPIYIEGYTQNKNITFTIYGVETRDASHKVRFESEVLTRTDPVGEKISINQSQPLGFIDVQKAHTGYTARLWQIIEKDGNEVSREVINKSTYQASPRTATVGAATDNPIYAQRLQNAVATGSIDVIKAEVSAIKNEQAMIQQMLVEQQNGQQQ